MTAFRLLAMCALVLAGSAAGAQIPPGGFVGFPNSPPLPPLPPPPRDRGFGGFFVYERDYEPVIEREIIREVAAPAPPAPPPPPRKPYVVGRTYDALPGGCMKLIQDGGSYYLCSGEWYRPLGGGRYLAIAQP